MTRLPFTLQTGFCSAFLWLACVQLVAGEERDPDDAAFQKQFEKDVQPLLKTFCWHCHNANKMKSGVRVDHLTATPEDRHLSLWKAIASQISDEAMPPDDEPQPTAAQRKTLTNWAERTLAIARSRPVPRNGSIRRLTVAQYRNTLRELLGLREDLTDALPPDGISKEGFTNHESTLTLSPLQIEAYFDIAQRALDACIVDESARPEIQNFRMDFGAKINPEPCPDKLILGALSSLLENADFQVTELTPTKPFEYRPKPMRTNYEFIEGYAGNDTVRGWRKYNSIYHSVFACLRGTPGYPKGDAHQVVPEGLLLRPAIPSSELFGISNTYGPMANFKISLRELPDEGNFRVTVRAARYADALLLDRGAALADAATAPAAIADLTTSAESKVAIERDGIYQIEVTYAPGDSKPADPKAAAKWAEKGGDAKDRLSLQLGERHFAGQLYESKSAAGEEAKAAFALVRLPRSEVTLSARIGNNARLKKVAFHAVAEHSDAGRRFRAFERRSPSLGVHVGLRRDCGSTLTQVGEAQPVSTGDLRDYVFEGAIRDFPSPDVEKDNVNYLAGIREIGVRSEYTDGRDMPRLVIRSIEFEGPYYDSWPPPEHRGIFVASEHRPESAKYAREIIRSFATRAFRRPIQASEEAAISAVWEKSFADRHDFQQSVKDALLVVLTSPQFLFLIENSSGPEAEDLDGYELASKLSYFLWNTAPDRRLLDLAAKGELRGALDAEIDRLLADPRSRQFDQEFVSQWLALDKFDVVATDMTRYPKLTRDARTQLRQEPVEFVRYLIQHNLPLRNLVQSDFLVANETVASYYDLGNRTESGFAFVPIQHANSNLGGLLSQASILAGLSDGRESNPVKRGAWLARKLIAKPPDDPPPNVPQIKDEPDSKLTLREKLERHRNQEGCAKCHSGIDPWGVPFESFDAGGLFKSGQTVDARSKLPDGTEVADLNGLKAYLADTYLDQVAFSLLKHAAGYATGRSLSYNELASLRDEGLKLRSQGYRTRDLLRLVVHQDLFLKK